MKEKNGHGLAMQKFNEAIQLCKDEADISCCCQMLAVMSIKTIHGIEGGKFKKEFLLGAITDNEKIVPSKVTSH